MQASLDLLWGVKPKASRGPAPSLSPERIVQAAIVLASQRGVGGLSMRAIATKVGCTTMALYRYVRGKDELIVLMLDAVVGPPPDLSDVRGGWRPQLEHWARLEWAIFQRHPWSLPLMPKYFLMGPQRLGWLEAALRAVSSSGLDDRELMDVVNLVDRHVRGLAQELAALSEQAELSRAEWWTAHAPFLTERPVQFATVLRAFSGRRAGAEHDEFDFSLARILDGVEALVRARTRSRPR